MSLLIATARNGPLVAFAGISIVKSPNFLSEGALMGYPFGEPNAADMHGAVRRP